MFIFFSEIFLIPCAEITQVLGHKALKFCEFVLKVSIFSNVFNSSPFVRHKIY